LDSLPFSQGLFSPNFKENSFSPCRTQPKLAEKPNKTETTNAKLLNFADKILVLDYRETLGEETTKQECVRRQALRWLIGRLRSL